VYALWGFFIGFLVFHEMRKCGGRRSERGKKPI
jgi:hypothetical protein